MMECVACPSPNFTQRAGGGPIDILLLHYTGMQTGAAALQRLCDPDARVSAHYTVDEDGTIYNHVPEEARAHHAGVSFWAGATDINSRSIGIEIVNPGHEFGYRSFPDAQIAAVIALSKDIFSRHEIPPERVIGHSDVAPARKQDPGELFPWATLARAGVGLWPGAGKTPLLERTLDVGFEAALRRFGYGTRPNAEVSLEQATVAFQRHFRPGKLDGKPDEECERILAALLTQLH
jgi:N-acetylmuramoyl-L-alanine amidase